MKTEEKKISNHPGKNIIYPKVGLREVLNNFWKGMKPKKWVFLTLILSVVFANIVIILVPLFYKRFFDIISEGGDKSIVAKNLFITLFYILAFNLICWLLYRVATLANNDFEPATMSKLKQQAYDHLMGHSYSFFVNNFSGSLVQRVNRLARAFEKITDDFVWILLPLIVRVISILIVVFFINKWMDLVLLIWIIVFLAFNILFSRWKLKYDIKVSSADSVATGYLSDTITNQNNVQLFNGFNFESNGYKEVTNQQAKMTKLAWNLDAIVEAGQTLLGFLIEFLLFFYAIRYWEQGLVTVGVFVLLQAYIINIIDQLWGFNRLIRDLYQGYADSKEMVEINLLPHEVVDVPLAKELEVNKGEIIFKDLVFSFDKKKEALKGINITIKPGEKIALIGPSGAGKTTFVKLLLRLYSPTAGQILIDGQDISEVTQESLRKNISMVPQDPVLFHRTLAENISYGRRDADQKSIEKSAKLAHCDEFIKNLPDGFKTYVGERGIKLSGGERQRVAIARSILKNAPILILDEATSSLDSASEMLIQDALNTLMAGKTTIVIAHRLSTIQKMDRILVIDDGRILEEGSHAKLLRNKKSLYKKLWELQAGGFLKTGKEYDELSPEKNIEEVEEEGEDEDGDKATLVNF